MWHFKFIVFFAFKKQANFAPDLKGSSIVTGLKWKYRWLVNKDKGFKILVAASFFKCNVTREHFCNIYSPVFSSLVSKQSSLWESIFRFSCRPRLFNPSCLRNLEENNFPIHYFFSFRRTIYLGLLSVGLNWKWMKGGVHILKITILADLDMHSKQIWQNY